MGWLKTLLGRKQAEPAEDEKVTRKWLFCVPGKSSDEPKFRDAVNEFAAWYANSMAGRPEVQTRPGIFTVTFLVRMTGDEKDRARLHHAFQKMLIARGIPCE